MFFLFTSVSDYEGEFGSIEEYSTIEEAKQSAEVFNAFNERYRETSGIDFCWKIIEGTIITNKDYKY